MKRITVRPLAYRESTTSFYKIACLILTYTLITGCVGIKNNTNTLSNVLTNLQPLTKRVKSYQTALRQNYCKELFLRYGYDVTNKTSLNPETSISYDRCLEEITEHPYSTDNFGLALSGGGARSASYAMGVLKALDEDKHLARFDTISSVSGGGYTSFWYFIQRYYQFLPQGHSGMGYYTDAATNKDKTDTFCQTLRSTTPYFETEELFKNRRNEDILTDTPFQNHLENQHDIINYSNSTMGKYAETTGLFAAHLSTLPFYWTSDILFNTRIFKGSVLTNAYRKGLERTYGLVSNKKHSEYAEDFYQQPNRYINGQNGDFLWWKENASIHEIHFKDYRAFMQVYNHCVASYEDWGRNERYRHPISLPIINTKLSRPATIFKSYEHADASSLEKSIFTFTPLDWGSDYTGYFNDNEIWAPTYMSKAVAVSGAAADTGARQVNGVSDGLLIAVNGNLGLTVRNPQTQYDGWGTAWFWIDKLIGGFPLGLFIPEDAKATLHLSDGGHAENLGLYSLIKRGTRHIVVMDAEHDPSYIFEALNRIKIKLKQELNLELSCKEETKCPLASKFLYHEAEPVFQLQVNGLPGINRNIEILYLKLAITNKNLSGECDNTPTITLKGCLPSHVVEYYKREKNKQENSFPQNTTFDLWYDEDQYRAYRDLGYFNTKHYLSEKVDAWTKEIEKGRNDEKHFFCSLWSAEAAPAHPKCPRRNNNIL